MARLTRNHDLSLEGSAVQPRDWFIVGVRLMGAWWLAQTVIHIFFYLEARLLEGPSQSPASSYLFGSAGYAVLALYFLLGTNHLARLTYGAEIEAPTAAPSQEPAEPPPPTPEISG
jgi:hypothetical protein